MDKESLCAGRRGDGWQREGGGDKGAPRRSTIQPRFCVFLDGERWSREVEGSKYHDRGTHVRFDLGRIVAKISPVAPRGNANKSACVDCAKNTSSYTSKPLDVQAAAFIAVGANYSHVVTESR